MSVFSAHAQDKKLQKLDKLYSKGKIEQCLAKAQKLAKDSDYKRNPGPYYYEALCYVKQSEAAQKYRITSFLEKSVKALELCFKYSDDSAGYNFSEIKIHLEHHALTLYETKNRTKARYFCEILATHFADTLDHYDELCSLNKYKQSKTQPKVIDEGKAVGSKTLSLRDSLLNFAATMVGVRYQYGGKSRSGTDCSGFTGQVFHQFRIDLPRTSRSQAELGEKVSLKDAQKGDLVFFGSKKNGQYRVNHVALVSSNPGEPLQVIHATTSKGVMYNVIEESDYWERKVLFIKNVLDTDQLTKQ